MTKFLLGLTLAFLFVAGAQNNADPALQGKWTVIGAQHGGKPLEGLTGGTMMITANQFEIRTASGSTLKGALEFNTNAKPAVMAMLHDSGLRWQAIYEVDGEDFKLNYIDMVGRDKLPTAFNTSTSSEETLVILKRMK